MKFYISLILASFIGVWLYRKIAIKRKIMDIPNERSSHTIPTPRGGGVAIAILWFIAITYEFLFFKSMPNNLYYACWSGGILAIVGIVDDIKDISPKIRMIAQVISAGLALFFLGGLQKVDLGFYTFESVWILTPVTFIAIIWFINLFNFLDGIDGHLATEVIFITAGACLFVLNSIALIIACITLGFLFLNWQKAKIFMGDVGSTLLGFNIAVLAIYFQNTDRSSIIMWIMLSSVFWFDATFTLLRRWRNKEQLSKAHKKHAYQRIVQFGFSHQKTVLFASTINIIILGLVVLSFQYAELTLIFLLINIALLYFIDYLIGKKKPFPKQ